MRSLIASLRRPSADGCATARATIGSLLERKYSEPVSTVENAQFLLSVGLSTKSLPGYATLDEGHIDSIKKVLVEIQRYARDTWQRRPLNFLMLAAPGAGKSHFIDCVARALAEFKVQAVTFDMTALERSEYLIPALDKVRNLKVQDKVPILFLDEFDSNQNNIPLLLPLLWEGGMNLGQRELMIGRAVIVLAGSNPVLPQVMDQARSMRQGLVLQTDTHPKIVDLLSRINGGVIQIPPFEQVKPPSERLVDKACIAIALLRRQFGDALRTVPLGLLQFIVRTDFRYGVRSIDHLISKISHQRHLLHLTSSNLGALPFTSLRALKESSLAYHMLHFDDPNAIVESWQHAKNCTTRMLISVSDVEPLPRFLETNPSVNTLELFLQSVDNAISSESADDDDSVGLLSRYLNQAFSMSKT